MPSEANKTESIWIQVRQQQITVEYQDVYQDKKNTSLHMLYYENDSQINNQNENGSKFAKQVGNNNHLGLLLGEYKGKKLKTLG